MEVILFAVLACSCAKTAGNNDFPGEVRIGSFSAVYSPIEDETVTKNTVTSVKNYFEWRAGDEIGVVDFARDGGAVVDRYVYDTSKGDYSSAYFKTPGEASYSYGETDVLIVIYPRESFEVVDGDIILSLRNTNIGYSGTNRYLPLAANDIQVAKVSAAELASGEKLTLTRVVSFFTLYTSVMEEELKTETITTFTVDIPQGVGSAKLNYSGTTPTVSGVTGTPTVYTHSAPPNIATSQNPVVNFVPVFPFNASTGWTFTFTTGNFEVGFHRQVNSNYTRGTHYRAVLSEGAYTKVESSAEATFDKAYWVTDLRAPFPGADTGSGADGSESTGESDPGDFVPPEGFSSGFGSGYGSTPGSFIKPQGN